MECSEDQVTGLGDRQGRSDRLEIAHLTDEDYVRILSQRVLQGGPKALRVRPNLALVDHAPLVAVHELDRILDRDDVTTSLAIHLVDHRGKRCRFTRASRTGHENQTARSIR